MPEREVLFQVKPCCWSVALSATFQNYRRALYHVQRGAKRNVCLDAKPFTYNALTNTRSVVYSNMHSSIMKLVHLFCLASLAWIARANDDPSKWTPWALSFGISAVDASRVHASGEVEHLKFNTSSAYRDFMNDAVLRRRGQVNHSGDTYNEETVRSLFQATTGEITKRLNHRQGFTARFATFAMPPISFLNTPAVAEVFPHLFDLAGREVEEEPRNVREWAEMSCYAYDLASCNTVELTAEECADDENEKLALVVHVEPDFLLLNIVIIDFESRVFPRTSERFLGDYGSRSSQALQKVCLEELSDSIWANWITGTWI